MSWLDDIKARLDSQDEMELVHSDLAALVAVVEGVQRIRDTMRAEAGKWTYLEMGFEDQLDAALRPLTEEEPK